MTRINSVNHAGWYVQWLSEEGWRNVYNKPCASMDEADEYTEWLSELNPDVEYRCYEALHMKEQA